MAGKRKIRCLGIYLAVLFLVLSVPTHIYAAAGGFLEGYAVEGQNLEIYCMPFGTDGESAKASQFKVTLSAQELQVTEALAVGEANIPVTYYCLADVSGSMRPEQMQQAKDVLLAVCEGMGENDNMLIGSLGNELSVSGFLQDKNAIIETVNALEAGNEDTNLYAGIVKSIDILKKDSQVNRKKCLVIVSDGEDDQKSGITQKEAEEAVSSSAIPVYTIAALRSEPTEAQLEFAKLLGSFARLSVGGIHCAPVVDGIEAKEAAGKIVEHEKNGIVLTVDTKGISKDAKDVMVLRVNYTSGDQMMEDSLEVFAADLPDTEEIVVPINSTEEDLDPLKPKQDRKWILICVAAGALLLIIAVVLFFIRKKKKAKAEAGFEDRMVGEEDDPDIGIVQSGPKDIGAEDTSILMRQPQLPVCEIRFVAIGYEDICFTLQIPEGRIQTIGRDSRADFILNPEDRHLSGVHCKIRCRDGALEVWDVSMNGTFYKGVLVKKLGMVRIESGQCLRMGSYEYRISIRRV